MTTASTRPPSGRRERRASPSASSAQPIGHAADGLDQDEDGRSQDPQLGAGSRRRAGAASGPCRGSRRALLLDGQLQPFELGPPAPVRCGAIRSISFFFARSRPGTDG